MKGRCYIPDLNNTNNPSLWIKYVMSQFLNLKCQGSIKISYFQIFLADFYKLMKPDI